MRRKKGRALGFDAVGAGTLIFEFCKAVEGGLGNFVKGVIGEEGLMSGNEDVGEGEKSGEDVIGQDIGGVVGKEEAGFLLVDIDGEPANVAAFESGNDCVGVKNRPAAGVDEDDPFFHSGESGGVDQMARGGEERHMESEDIRFTQDFLLGDIAG